MRLTEAQLRQILRASAQHPEHGTSDRSDQVIKTAVVDTSAGPKQKIADVMCATEKVILAADDVIRATQKVVPGSQADETSPSFQDAQGGLIEQDKFSLPVPISGPKGASRRSTVPLIVALSVLLVSAVVVASVMLVGEPSQSPNVETREPSTSVALSEPGVAKAVDAADRPSQPADAPAQALAPSTQPRAEAPSVQDARPAVLGAGRDSAAPADAGSRAMTAAPAPAALARPTATSQPARGGGSVAGNASVAGNTVAPQAQTQRAGTGSERVATVGPKAGGASGSPPQPSSPHQDAPAAGIAAGVGGASARGTAEGLTACLAARPAALRLPQDETAKLFKRGEEYMGQGRISAARLLFQRAAEACDRKSAFALGATYDPLMMKKFGATLLDPNVATARVWYEQAKRLGLSEASRQLELLSTLPQ